MNGGGKVYQTVSRKHCSGFGLEHVLSANEETRDAPCDLRMRAPCPPAWPGGRCGSRSRTRSRPRGGSTWLFTKRPLPPACSPPPRPAGATAGLSVGRGTARFGGVCSLQLAQSPNSKTMQDARQFRKLLAQEAVNCRHRIRRLWRTGLWAGITGLWRGGDRETSPTPVMMRERGRPCPGPARGPPQGGSSTQLS